MAEIKAEDKSGGPRRHENSCYPLVLQLARELANRSTDATPIANLVRDKLTRKDHTLIQQDWNESFEWLLDFLVEGSGPEVCF